MASLTQSPHSGGCNVALRNPSESFPLSPRLLPFFCIALSLHLLCLYVSLTLGVTLFSGQQTLSTCLFQGSACSHIVPFIRHRIFTPLASIRVTPTRAGQAFSAWHRQQSLPPEQAWGKDSCCRSVEKRHRGPRIKHTLRVVITLAA